jgi:hypothetical protein
MTKQRSWRYKPWFPILAWIDLFRWFLDGAPKMPGGFDTAATARLIWNVRADLGTRVLWENVKGDR